MLHIHRQITPSNKCTGPCLPPHSPSRGMRRTELASAYFRKVFWVRCHGNVVLTCSALTLKMAECRQRLARTVRRTPLLGEWDLLTHHSPSRVSVLFDRHLCHDLQGFIGKLPWQLCSNVWCHSVNNVGIQPESSLLDTNCAGRLVDALY